MLVSACVCGAKRGKGKKELFLRWPLTSDLSKVRRLERELLLCGVLPHVERCSRCERVRGRDGPETGCGARSSLDSLITRRLVPEMGGERLVQMENVLDRLDQQRVVGRSREGKSGECGRDLQIIKKDIISFGKEEGTAGRRVRMYSL